MTNRHSQSPRSLLARGIDFLSRREHSRLELYRKLVRTLSEGETVDDVESALDTLEQKGYLSNERYAQARVRSRSVRYGNRRLALELREAGLDSDAIHDALEESQPEIDRARAVYKKKFRHAPSDNKEREKQVRFLASRGFSFSAINEVIKEASEQSLETLSSFD